MGRFKARPTAALALCVLLILPAIAWCGEVITLDQAIKRALAFAPSILSASANSDLSAGKLGEARSALYPNLLGAGEYNQAPGYDQRISNRGLTLGQLQANYTVYDGGRRQAQVRAARYAEAGGTPGYPGGASADCLRYHGRLFRPAAQRRGGAGTREAIAAPATPTPRSWRRCSAAAARSPTTCCACAPRATRSRLRWRRRAKSARIRQSCWVH